ncbi:MAG: hypothetical protein D6786_05705 [Gammaproteobacteria bacterium]|nr:MAG: hypothetical protein D6786_05705 [Gammaproteobacteria bacterium]
MPSPLIRAALAGCLLTVLPAAAQPAGEVAELKRMIAEMQQRYEARISALEQRLARYEAASAPAPATPAGTDAAPAEAPPAGAGVGDNAFNPALTLILQGRLNQYSLDPAGYALPGFQLGEEAGLADEGPGLGESELRLGASVDPLFYAEATFAFVDSATGGASVEIEEAYGQTLSLPWGLGLRFGRFYAETGYLNTRHSHAWDFADETLTSRAFLGGQYRDDGLRLSWLAPTDTYLELGVELLRGDAFPAGGADDESFGEAQNAYLRAGLDLNESHSLLLGLSWLRTRPGEREGNGFAFDGESDLAIAHLVWKWAPQGDSTRRQFIFQGEYFHRDESGLLSHEDAAGVALLDYDGVQQGFYAQGIYKFLPRWRAGVRYDRLWSDNTLALRSNTSGLTDPLDESGLDDGGVEPSRLSAMLDFSPSEFSRLRLQYALDESRGETDHQTLLQYILSLGTHGAHPY